jgi:hypothetical protein
MSGPCKEENPGRGSGTSHPSRDKPRPQSGEQREHPKGQKRKTVRMSDNHRRVNFLSGFPDGVTGTSLPMSALHAITGPFQCAA